MTELFFLRLKKVAWILFFVLLLLNLADLSIKMNNELFLNSLPFRLDEDVPQKFKDKELENILRNCIVTSIDTLQISFRDNSTSESNEVNEDEDSQDGPTFIFLGGTNAGFQFDISLPLYFEGQDSVKITYQDTLSQEIGEIFVKTVPRLNYNALINVITVLILIIFAYFNSYLLLKYSKVKENVLIVFFLLLLMSPNPDTILSKHLSDFWSLFVSPFWGILFYHFVILKTKTKKSVKKLYLNSTIIFGVFYILSIFWLSLTVAHIWSVFWLLKSFLLLRKEYRKTHAIELKRLWAAFSGIGISLISIISFFVVVILVVLIAGVSSLTGLSSLIGDTSNVFEIIGAIAVLIPILGIFLGFLWFLGSFSWSLLTGTALDVKIRSTMIYSIIGILFITFFGLIDYSLGELLQFVFGKFVGSEFVAGIPVTIGLIAFFNPVRNKVEKIVDNKLNTSELDFLEKTDSFTRNLSEEGVLEGFEEYICENLIQRLPVRKVALVSYDRNLKDFKFNEVRGSDVQENSRVEDVNLILSTNKIYRNYNSLTDNPQEISSFTLILPIIFEEELKWFLALGEKNDESDYSKKDVKAFEKLTERIKLSLKFILAYEDIVDQKYLKELSKKDKLIKEKNLQIKELKGLLKK